MENIIYTDADLNAFLVANEEQDGNTIEVVIECDSTGSQSLTITAGLASATETLTPGEKNHVDIPSMLWNFGNDTVITLTKGGSTAGTITIHFPGAIEFDAALNETETDNEFLMQGSATVEQQVVSLQKEVEKVSARSLDYILPSAISQTAIADGANNTVETFEFEAAEENVKVSLFTCIQFLATTTVTVANVYEDLNTTITISLDGNAVATILHVYRDGRQVLMLNYLVEGISKGNHTVTVNIAAAGGSVSVVQVVAAYMLVAKSTAAGHMSEQSLFSDGAFAPGVLLDDLNPKFLTKAANDNGTEYTIVKYAQSATAQEPMPNISTLSDWYLSKYALATMMYYGTLPYTDNGAIMNQSVHDGGCDVAFYLPIKRIAGFNKLVYESKNTYSGQYNYHCLSAAAIVDGVLRNAPVTWNSNISDWTTFTVNISGIPYVDYLMINTAVGNPQFRNIRLVKDN
jgi:hypothetical protein